MAGELSLYPQTQSIYIYTQIIVFYYNNLSLCMDVWLYLNILMFDYTHTMHNHIFMYVSIVISRAILFIIKYIFISENVLIC